MSICQVEQPSSEADVVDPPRRTVARPVRVCHVSLTLCTGGLERLLLDTARFHDSARFELSFVALRETGRFADAIRSTGCLVHRLNRPDRIREVWELRRWFRDQQIDVVHTHDSYPHFYATLAARLAGVPVAINTQHGCRWDHRWAASLPYRFAGRLVDRMVANSDDSARKCVDVDRISEERVSRIWSGIDLNNFCWRGPAATPSAICVARLSEEKDFPTLLRAVQHAVLEVPDFKLRIVGDGPERARIDGLRTEWNLEDHVELLGERVGIPELLSQAGFFVSSALRDGNSLALLEAMAVGLPVVATAVGATPEIVKHDGTGLLMPAADPQALGAALVEMCRRKQEWLRMGRRGRLRVGERFDIRWMVRDYEALYDAQLAEKRASGNQARSTNAVSRFVLD
jgi:glycosyltransferase involved in cell wall biosynthesis